MMLFALLCFVVGATIDYVKDARRERRRARMKAQAGRLLDRG